VFCIADIKRITIAYICQQYLLAVPEVHR